MILLALFSSQVYAGQKAAIAANALLAKKPDENKPSQNLALVMETSVFPTIISPVME